MATKTDLLHMGPGVSAQVAPLNEQASRVVRTDIIDVSDPTAANCYAAAKSAASVSYADPPMESVRVIGLERDRALRIVTYGWGNSGAGVVYRPVWRARGTTRSFRSHFAEDDTTPLDAGRWETRIRPCVTYDYMLWDKTSLSDALDSWAGLANYLGYVNYGSFVLWGETFLSGMVRFDGFFADQRSVGGSDRVNLSLRFTVDPKYWRISRIVYSAGPPENAAPAWANYPDVAFPALPT